MALEIIMLRIAILAVVACAAVNAGPEDPLCKKFGSSHSACFPEKTCPTTTSICGLPSDQEKEAILKRVNELRQRIAQGKENRGLGGKGQPAGKNIYEVTWNDDLARVAQRWASSQTWGHDCDDCRKTLKFSSVGQNGASASSTGSPNYNWIKPVDEWYSEVDDFQYPTTGAPNKMIGHYTQLVWWESSEIGCGAWVFTKGIWTTTRTFCNFGPTGNWQGEAPYSTTGSCTKSSAKYPGLCVR